MAKRMFIALELPADCRRELAGITEPVPGVRWLRAEQLHLTLAFLGKVDEESEARLRQGLAGLRALAFQLLLRGVGSFGGRRGTVIWAGVEDGNSGLCFLHHVIRQVLQVTFPGMRQGPFRPHITLARVKDAPPRQLRAFLQAHEAREFGVVEIDAFTLFSSVTDPAGSIHTVEARYDLAAP